MADYDDPLKEIKNKVKQQQDEYSCKNPSELVNEWAERIIKNQGRPLNLGFEKLDKNFDGDLRGKLGAFIGYGGTKKSLLALNCLNLNANIHKINGVYSTMEMTPNLLLDRLIDYSFDHYESNDGSEKYNPSFYFKRRLKNKEEQDKCIEFIHNGLLSFYGNHLQINAKTNMLPDDYRRVLDGVANKLGGVDLLVVDGLSMMGGYGAGETDDYSKNTKELKEIANEYDIFVALICHLSKGADKHTRDTQKLVRGSQKILDNCDFIVMMSLILESMSHPPEYSEKYGWIRLFDKRGTGKTIDQIYEFDKMRLILQDCNIDPKEMEQRSVF